MDGFMLRPMNCPMHIKIFDSSHSYRNLPVRLAEFGTVYRWEQSGELNGLNASAFHSGRCPHLLHRRTAGR